MGLLDNVVRGAEYRSSPLSGLARPASWLVDALSTGKTASGQRVTAEKALGVPAVWAAVSLISEIVSTLPLKVYRELPGGDGEVVVARDHRAWRMLHDKPNPITPAGRFWSTATAHLLLWGNVFVEKIRSDTSGLVEELWLLDPRKTGIEWNGGTRRKQFVQQTPQGKRTWTDDQVLHIMGFSLDGLVGESVISRVRQSFGTALARDEFEGEFYGNGAVMRLGIEHPGKLSPAGDREGNALKNLRESVSAIYGGSGNRHQVGVLEEGATWKVLSMPLDDMQFVASQQLTATQVAIMFHLPPGRLGGTTGDSLTYATVEGNQIELSQDAIVPPTSAIAQALAADPAVFPFASWYPEFVLEGRMRGDHKTRAEFYTSMFGLVDEIGRRALDIDEIRARENLGPGKVPPTPPTPPAPPAANDNGNGNGGARLTPADLAALGVADS